jgi:Pyruvate/2-oxoacid:ferredoxin oxidoreductase delta subunit
MKKNLFPAVDCTKCTRCKKCIETCQESAVQLIRSQYCSRCIKYCISMDVPCNPFQIEFDYAKCTGCGLCFDVCPGQAIFQCDERNILNKTALVKIG